jgi:hypothetical protein
MVGREVLAIDKSAASKETGISEPFFRLAEFDANDLLEKPIASLM